MNRDTFMKMGPAITGSFLVIEGVPNPNSIGFPAVDTVPEGQEDFGGASGDYDASARERRFPGNRRMGSRPPLTGRYGVSRPTTRTEMFNRWRSSSIVDP